MDKKYWEKYYSNSIGSSEPSDFAKYCTKYIKTESVILDLGCGNGRDSIYFAKINDNQVYACDQSEEAIQKLKCNFDNPIFFKSDVTNIKFEFEGTLNVIYARFLLHALDKKEASEVLNWSYENLASNGLFMTEARSVKSDIYGTGEKIAEETYIVDKEFDYEVEPHKRRFLKRDIIEKEILSLGFEIIEIVESNGLAMYRNDNPVVIRIIAKKH